MEPDSSSESSEDEVAVRCHEITDSVIKLHHAVRTSKLYNFEGLKVPLLLNGMNSDHFEEKLSGYVDSNLCKFVKYGWPIGHNGLKTNCNAKRNHNGAREFPDQVDLYINSEISLGRIIGPFITSPYSSDIAVSPLNSLGKRIPLIEEL